MTVLLRDKFLFYKFMKSFNMPVPEVTYVIRNGQLLDTALQPADWETFKKEKDYFLKALEGECAYGVMHIHDYDEYMQYADKFKTGSYIVQKRIGQKEELSKLNPCAINTIRMVTVKNKDKAQVFSAVLRIGTQVSGSVDNWAQGGIAVGIEADGRLKKVGFMKPKHGGRVTSHPDTGIVFEDYTIPNYAEAVNLAVKAHQLFYGVHSIGWDIVVTEDGPMFIEGNDNWEISLMQACNGGLKEKWLEGCAGLLK